MSFSSTIRTQLRHWTLSGLAMSDQVTGKFESIKDQNHLQVILLHDVFPHEEKNFKRLLDWLSERFTFVSYSTAAQQVQQGNISEPTLTFSFDDGMENNKTAAKILSDRSIPACFFVCPDIVEETSETKIAEFCKQQLHRDPCNFLNWDDLGEMKSWGHEIGSHTLNHVMLSSTSIQQAEVEINRSRELIEKNLGEAIHFAWPYGRFSHITKQTIELILKAGYQSYASGERGSHGAHQESITEPICIRRESLDLSWPLSHIQYFISKSARAQIPPQSSLPKELNPTHCPV